jgi:hypothetical protein
MNFHTIFGKLFLGIILITFLFNISSCSEHKKKEKIITIKLSQEDAMNAEMKSIDAEIETSGKVVTSLRYVLENGEFVVVYAHLSSNDEILKIEEEFNDGEKGNTGINAFYLKDGNIFLTREYMEDRTVKSAPKFIERISYYDKKEKVEKTIEKRVDFEEDIDNASFSPTELHALSIERAKKVLDQKDEFEITFQGIFDINATNFLSVGSHKKNGYTSTIRCEYDDDFIRLLLSNQKKYLNKKIQVSFQNIKDATGMVYQSYIQGKFED